VQDRLWDASARASSVILPKPDRLNIPQQMFSLPKSRVLVGLFQFDDICRGCLRCVMTLCSAQEAWRDVPLAPIVGDDRDGSFVVAGENALDQAMTAGVETHPVADTEIEHAGMGPHLLEETQALDNPVVEVNEFSFTQSVNIDPCHVVTVCDGIVGLARR
jgi:hypothetical protein